MKKILLAMVFASLPTLQAVNFKEMFNFSKPNLNFKAPQFSFGTSFSNKWQELSTKQKIGVGATAILGAAIVGNFMRPKTDAQITLSVTGYRTGDGILNLESLPEQFAILSTARKVLDNENITTVLRDAKDIEANVNLNIWKNNCVKIIDNNAFILLTYSEDRKTVKFEYPSELTTQQIGKPEIKEVGIVNSAPTDDSELETIKKRYSGFLLNKYTIMPTTYSLPSGKKVHVCPSNKDNNRIKISVQENPSAIQQSYLQLNKNGTVEYIEGPEANLGNLAHTVRGNFWNPMNTLSKATTSIRNLLNNK